MPANVLFYQLQKRGSRSLGGRESSGRPPVLFTFASPHVRVGSDCVTVATDLIVTVGGRRTLCRSAPTPRKRGFATEGRLLFRWNAGVFIASLLRDVVRCLI